MKGIIYKYTSPNNKSYIGQTIKTIKERAGKDGYRYKSCPMFYNAIQKYGWDNFKCEILLSVDLPDDELRNYLNEKEKYYIKLYDTQANGYNTSPGGDAPTWLNLDEEEIIRLYTQERKTLRQIAEIFNVDWSVIQTRLHNNNIDTAGVGEHSPAWRIDIADNIKDIITLYKDGNSCIKIAKLYNTTDQTIKRHLEINGVSIASGNSRPVNQLTLDGQFIARYNTMKEAAAAVGLCGGCIIKKALDRPDKTSKGYKWEYAL